MPEIPIPQLTRTDSNSNSNERTEPNGRERESERLIEVLLLILQVAIGTAEANGNLGEPCQWPSSLVTDTFSLPRPLSLSLALAQSLRGKLLSSGHLSKTTRNNQRRSSGSLADRKSCPRRSKPAPAEETASESFGELRGASRSFEELRSAEERAALRD